MDYDETFSPVVKPATIRTALFLALSQHWSIHQLHVKNAFVHGTLTETVYTALPDHVCLLNKSLWYNCFDTYLLSLVFVEAKVKADTSLFIYHRGTEVVYLLLHVDDNILTASSDSLLCHTISTLQQEFSMKDLCLHDFLGISV